MGGHCHIATCNLEPVYFSTTSSGHARTRDSVPSVSETWRSSAVDYAPIVTVNHSGHAHFSGASDCVGGSVAQVEASRRERFMFSKGTDHCCRSQAGAVSNMGNPCAVQYVFLSSSRMRIVMIASCVIRARSRAASGSLYIYGTSEKSRREATSFLRCSISKDGVEVCPPPLGLRHTSIAKMTMLSVMHSCKCPAARTRGDVSRK